MGQPAMLACNSFAEIKGVLVTKKELRFTSEIPNARAISWTNGCRKYRSCSI